MRTATIERVTGETNIKVTVFFFIFFVVNVIAVCRKPLLSITLIPINNIIKLDNTVKFAKFDTVWVNIYFIPDKLNNELTTSVSGNTSKVTLLIL